MVAATSMPKDFGPDAARTSAKAGGEPGSASDESRSRERHAISVVLNGSTTEKIGVAWRSLRGLLKDPSDTELVQAFYVIANLRNVPRTMFRFMTEPGGLELMQKQPAIDSRALDFDALFALGQDTLGHAYVAHLRSNGLDADFFQAPPGLPPAIAYLAKRLRQSHDIWHVLTGYGTDIPGELALQAFTYAQTGAPGAAVTALVGTLRFGALKPRMGRELVVAYRRGKRAKSLLAVHWEDLWATPLSEVRRSLMLD